MVKVSGIVKIGQVKVDFKELSSVYDSGVVAKHIVLMLEDVKKSLENVLNSSEFQYPELIRKELQYRYAELDYKIDAIKEELRGDTD